LLTGILTPTTGILNPPGAMDGLRAVAIEYFIKVQNPDLTLAVGLRPKRDIPGHRDTSFIGRRVAVFIPEISGMTVNGVSFRGTDKIVEIESAYINGILTEILHLIVADLLVADNELNDVIAVTQNNLVIDYPGYYRVSAIDDQLTAGKGIIIDLVIHKWVNAINGIGRSVMNKPG